MADLLRRHLAPLPDEAWTEIDQRAARVLKFHLTARTLVDFSGPHGWAIGAVNLGHLEIRPETAQGVPWGVRRALPLIEVRIPFHLSQLELDNIARGSRDADLEPLEEAARKLAHFEESVIYTGFDEGGMQGILKASRHPAPALSGGGETIAHTVGEAIKLLEAVAVEGPYALVLGTQYYHALVEAVCAGYPPANIIREMLRGPILWSPALEAGVVLSTRGGDFELTVGQDISIGYASHDRERVELYLTESFAFRILDDQAAVPLALPTH